MVISFAVVAAERGELHGVKPDFWREFDLVQER